MQKIKTGSISVLDVMVQPKVGASRKVTNSTRMRIFVLSYNEDERSYTALQLMLTAKQVRKAVTLTIRDKGILNVISQEEVSSDLLQWNISDAIHYLHYEASTFLAMAGHSRLKENPLTRLNLSIRRLESAKTERCLELALLERKAYLIGRRTPIQMEKLSKSVRRKLNKKQKMRRERRGSTLKRTTYSTPNSMLAKCHADYQTAHKVAIKLHRTKEPSIPKYAPQVKLKLDIPF